jgi:hypothetical protein
MLALRANRVLSKVPFTEAVARLAVWSVTAKVWRPASAAVMVSLAGSMAWLSELVKCTVLA